MNYKILRISIVLAICLITNVSVFSQVATDNTIKGRYLIIEDTQTFFSNQENTMVCESFVLFNILEDESSKPAHVGVTELSDVIKFSIKSNSEKYENQRFCRLVMKAENYKNTFRKVLIKMDVKNILYQGELITVDEFYLLTK